MPEPRFVHLVDDDASTRQATSSLLSEHKYSVLIHPSGEAFLHTFALLPSGTVLLRWSESAAGLAILPRLLARNITWPIVLLLNDGADRTVVRTLTLCMPDPG